MPIVIHAPAHSERHYPTAVRRGIRGLCPACGNARLFGAFLKPVATCTSCGLDVSRHQADDFPPYIVITVVAHVVIAGLLFVEQIWEPALWVHMTIWPALVIVLSLALIQPAKGAVIAHQWALRMHGFEKGDSLVPHDGADASPAIPAPRPSAR